MLLHRLQQGRLGARAGAVDLVGHQELGEDRALDEAERAAPSARLVEDLRAENVGGHQVRRELHPPCVEPEHGAERLDQLRLGEAGHADEQAVAAGQDRHQGEVDHLLLAEDDRCGWRRAPARSVSSVASADFNDRIVEARSALGPMLAACGSCLPGRSSPSAALLTPLAVPPRPQWVEAVKRCKRRLSTILTQRGGSRPELRRAAIRSWAPSARRVRISIERRSRSPGAMTE